MAKSIRCEYCGGNQIFNPKTSCIECEHCGKSSPCDLKLDASNLTRKYDISYIPAINTNIDNQYLCSSCGAAVRFEENEEKKRCPSCGDTALTRKQVPMYVPDGIIPFSIDRNKAVEIFKAWINSRKFAPRDIKEMAKLGKVSGLYVPAWNINIKIGGSYFANVTKLEDMGNDEMVTWHYPIRSNFDKTFVNILSSANQRIPDDVLEGLSPFDSQKLVPFSNEYLFGYSGLNTDENIHEKYEEIIQERKDRITHRCRSDLKAKFDTIESFNIAFTKTSSTFNYAYLPVWANHYTYRGKLYHCYINGQTGQATGKSPKSFWKILSLVLGIAVGVGALALVAMKYIF